jgi:hypothetical protein
MVIGIRLRLLLLMLKPYFSTANKKGHLSDLSCISKWVTYMILDTTPAPTVRPPSRIAKRKPSSIAMG